jgi:hypothetical protein
MSIVFCYALTVEACFGDKNSLADQVVKGHYFVDNCVSKMLVSHLYLGFILASLDDLHNVSANVANHISTINLR